MHRCLNAALLSHQPHPAISKLAPKLSSSTPTKRGKKEEVELSNLLSWELQFPTVLLHPQAMVKLNLSSGNHLDWACAR